jgi:hypothetical protein
MRRALHPADSSISHRSTTSAIDDFALEIGDGVQPSSTTQPTGLHLSPGTALTTHNNTLYFLAESAIHSHDVKALQHPASIGCILYWGRAVDCGGAL